MAIQSLSSDEVMARMRDLVARANMIHARNAASAADQVAGAAGLGGVGGIANGTSGSGERLDFQTLLKDAVRGVSDAQQTAQSKAQAYQLGDDKVSLEDVMISIQKASLAMQGMVQVRNRLVESYREVMNMQV
ncbi:MAG: flagellar hook-basal body complex protein FliE [Betaproteobacteria bacterium]|nr:flagellar hook-basal body complex protein FliE [Betaproteobacteria bacterium]